MLLPFANYQILVLWVRCCELYLTPLFEVGISDERTGRGRKVVEMDLFV